MRQEKESAQEVWEPERPSPQEGVRVGNLVVTAQYDRRALDLRTQRFRAQSYRVKETSHFVICQRPPSQRIVLMHRFDRTEINADLIRFIGEELSTYDMLSSAQAFHIILFAVIASTFPAPRNQAMIWRRFCLNTLVRLRALIAQPPSPSSLVDSHMVPFAAIYHRVLELFVGQNLLDVGSSFGFFPLLIAELMSDIDIVGCDNNPAALTCATDLAIETGAQHVSFTLRDVLSPDMPAMGIFDTVTALHVLEHLPEGDLPVAFSNLLHVTAQRLIVAVPFEEKAQALYGHQQVFTLEKLQSWGAWCVDALGGAGHFWCEEVRGGMLIVERSSQEKRA